MLGTRERTLLLGSLRPPPGYRLERAIGTSYTLDLLALLTAPLAFTFFDVHDERGDPVNDPVALLEALRRHAQRVTLFCQAGAIGVPKPGQALLAYLEGSVVEVRPPHDEGVFHPKVWLLKFRHDDDPPIYRVLCLSRNLTFDRAWDTCLCLEGPLTGRARGFGRNAPLGEFVAALPRIATRRLGDGLREELERIAHEVRRVDFRPPEPFDDLRIHPLGLDRKNAWPFPESTRSLAISPYLVESIVDRLVRDHGLEVLVSRAEALEEVHAEALPAKSYVLSAAARLDAREGNDDDDEPPLAANDPAEAPTTDEPELTGLHAKLFLFETGSTARLFTGSANATVAAFQLNVELVVELVGPSKRCGIASLLGDANDPKQDALRSLLQEYSAPEMPEEIDEERRALERRLDRTVHALGAARLTATVRAVDADQLYEIILTGAFPDADADAELRVWPVTIAADGALPVAAAPDQVIATFEGLSFEALTAFFAFEVTLRSGTLRASRRFTMSVDLVGAPEDRADRLLRTFLKDRRQVLRLLLLILMDEGADVSAFIEAARSDDKALPRTFGGWDEPTLLEALLQSLSRHPHRVEQAERLIADLGRSTEGRQLLPKRLEEIWEPVWAVREGLRG